MMVVAVLRLHLASFPYAQLAQPDLLPLLLLPPLDEPLPARRNLFDELDEPEEPDEPELPLSLLEDLPILFPWPT